jgi:hypothetical protein
MTIEEALHALRISYAQLIEVAESSLLDRSQKQMIDIAIGRTVTVGKQLKQKLQPSTSVQPKAA